MFICLFVYEPKKSYKKCLQWNLSRNRWLHFGDLLESGEALIIKQPPILTSKLTSLYHYSTYMYNNILSFVHLHNFNKDKVEQICVDKKRRCDKFAHTFPETNKYFVSDYLVFYHQHVHFMSLSCGNAHFLLHTKHRINPVCNRKDHSLW